MANILHRVGIKANINDVYQSIASIDGLSKWWTQDTSGSDKVGGTIRFVFKDLAGNLKGEILKEVTSLSPAKQVKWKNAGGPPDWAGTEVIFDLSQEGDYVIILFQHRGWAEETESTAHCNLKWGTFLLSLRDYLETGKGRPAPHDLQINNWH